MGNLTLRSDEMKRLLFISLLVHIMLFPLMSKGSFAQVDEGGKPSLSIVIDDLGNHMNGTEDILNLQAKLTVAIMPFMPSTTADANAAIEKGHEVIVHMPMEPKVGKKSWLGPGAITADLSDEEIRKRVEDAIENVPHAVGMNHHMGSKITEDKRIMQIVLEVCAERGLYYLDSKTTGKSVIPEIAEELHLPYLENNLFFDDTYSVSHIEKQTQRLENRLKTENRLIAIGHVGVSGPMMVTVLNRHIEHLKEKAHIIPLSEQIEGSEWLR